MHIQHTTLKPQQVITHVSMATTGEDLLIVSLGQLHLPQIIDLHEQTIVQLQPHEKAFMLQKPPSFFRDHFNKASGNLVIGILKEEQLIAEAIILCPSQSHPDTGMVDMAPVGDPEDITVMQGVSVLPEFRKNKLMYQMVNAWLKNAMSQGKTHALAEVEVHNIASWSVFLNQGMEIPSIGQDPSDGALVYNLHGFIPDLMKKKITCGYNHVAADAVLCSVDDIGQQKDMLDNGYVISGWRKESRQVILTPKP